MENFTWDSYFSDLFDKCVNFYNLGNKDFSTYYSDEDLNFLKSIGYKEREFFDFVEDYCDYKSPSKSTAILIASVRKDYFNTIMNKELSSVEIGSSSIPGRSPYAPRIIAKARAKLKGELHPDLMFCCGSDRKFLSELDIAPADFLRYVWAAGDDDEKIIKYLNI